MSNKNIPSEVNMYHDTEFELSPENQIETAKILYEKSVKEGVNPIQLQFLREKYQNSLIKTHSTEQTEQKNDNILFFQGLSNNILQRELVLETHESILSPELSDLIKTYKANIYQLIFEETGYQEKIETELTPIRNANKDTYNMYFLWKYIHNFIREYKDTQDLDNTQIQNKVLWYTKNMQGWLRVRGIVIPQETIIKNINLVLESKKSSQDISDFILSLEKTLFQQQAVVAHVSSNKKVRAHMAKAKALSIKNKEHIYEQTEHYLVTKSIYKMIEIVLSKYEEIGKISSAALLILGNAGTGKSKLLEVVSQLMNYVTLEHSLREYDDGTTLLESLGIASDSLGFLKKLEKFENEISNVHQKDTALDSFLEFLSIHVTGKTESQLNVSNLTEVKTFLKSKVAKTNTVLQKAVERIENKKGIETFLQQFTESIRVAHLAKEFAHLHDEAREPNTFVTKGMIAKAIDSKENSSVILNELNAPFSLKGLNTVLQTIYDFLLVFGTANTAKEYKMKSIAVEILNRFEEIVTMGYLNEKEQALFMYTFLETLGGCVLPASKQHILSKFPKLIQELRNNFNESQNQQDEHKKWKTPITTRDVIRFSKALIKNYGRKNTKNTFIKEGGIKELIINTFCTKNIEYELTGDYEKTEGLESEYVEKRKIIETFFQDEGLNSFLDLTYEEELKMSSMSLIDTAYGKNNFITEIPKTPVFIEGKAYNVHTQSLSKTIISNTSPHILCEYSKNKKQYVHIYNVHTGRENTLELPGENSYTTWHFHPYLPVVVGEDTNSGMVIVENFEKEAVVKAENNTSFLHTFVDSAQQIDTKNKSSQQASPYEYRVNKKTQNIPTDVSLKYSQEEQRLYFVKNTLAESEQTKKWVEGLNEEKKLGENKKSMRVSISSTNNLVCVTSIDPSDNSVHVQTYFVGNKNIQNPYIVS